VGRERGEKTNVKHLQGYIEFNRNVRFQTFRGNLKHNTKEDINIWIMGAKGKSIDNIKYCTKDYYNMINTGTQLISDAEVFLFGKPKEKNQGKRTDLVTLAIKAKEGISSNELALSEEGNTYLRYRKNIEDQRLSFLAEKAKTIGIINKKVQVLFGDSGVGKTTFAENYFSGREHDLYTLRKGKTGSWFTGYTSETCLFIEEFTGDIELEMLNCLLDNRIGVASIHGGIKPCFANDIIICSNRSPFEWYPHMNIIDKNALMRRIDIIYEYRKRIENDITYIDIKKFYPKAEFQKEMQHVIINEITINPNSDEGRELLGKPKLSPPPFGGYNETKEVVPPDVSYTMNKEVPKHLDSDDEKTLVPTVVSTIHHFAGPRQNDSKSNKKSRKLFECFSAGTAKVVSDTAATALTNFSPL